MIRVTLGGCAVVLVVLTGIATAQKAVDTRQFGLIQLRMQTQEVEKRLGPPAKIVSDPYDDIPGLLQLTYGQRVACHYAYYYPGTSRIPPTLICFAGDRVSGKWRMRR